MEQTNANSGRTQVKVQFRFEFGQCWFRLGQNDYWRSWVPQRWHATTLEWEQVEPDSGIVGENVLLLTDRVTVTYEITYSKQVEIEITRAQQEAIRDRSEGYQEAIEYVLGRGNAKIRDAQEEFVCGYLFDSKDEELCII